MGKFAWVTLATNDSYSMGALVLAHSLRRVNTTHQLVILITPGVTEAMKTQLSAVFNVVKLVDVLDSRDADNLALLARPELGITFTKLHCWKLTEYEKCVFLDADTLVLQNSDELFEREELSAAPDAGWPDCFNSGVFVYKPSQETFQALIEFALIHGSFDGGDQGLLNLFFSDWATKDIQKHLPFVYNMCSTATYSYLPAFKQYGAGLKIIHFIGAAKPWLQPFNTETGLVSVSGESQHLTQFVQLWWDIFCGHVHPSLSTEMAGLAGALATVTLGAPLTVEQQALEEHLRRQGWEQGNIDYMGKDSFANIWKKICETLGTPAPSAPPEDAPAPVAPVAAPVYVSSVEISPSGQIDKTPPQANYAPVSALKPTVEASDIKDANKAPVSETATVVPEPKPSVTEVAPLEAIVPPSATLETSTASPQVVSEPRAAQQTVNSVESAVKTDSTPEASSEVPETSAVTPNITPAPKEASAPVPLPTETPVTAPAVAEAPVFTTLAPASTTIEATVPTTPASTPTEVPAPTTPTPTTTTPTPTPAPTTPTPTTTTPPTPAPTTPTTTTTTPPTPAPTTPTPTTPTPAPTTPTPTTTTPPTPIPTPAPTTPTTTTTPPTPTPTPAPTTPTTTTPPTPTPTPVPTTTIPTTPAPTTPAPTTPAPTTPAPAPTEVPVPTPLEAPVLTAAVSTEVPVPVLPAPISTEAPVPTPIPTESLVSSPAAPTPLPTPTSTPSAPAPTETAPCTPPAPQTQIPTESSAPDSAKAPENVLAATLESIAPATEAELAQPQTPTVTEPTPPTSPPVATEAPQLAQLQVEAEVPATPPAGGSTQPSLEGAVANEPPVPPKRKGGSKAPQDSKNQKGGKPSKGKK